MKIFFVVALIQCMRFVLVRRISTFYQNNFTALHRRLGKYYHFALFNLLLWTSVGFYLVFFEKPLHVGYLHFSMMQFYFSLAMPSLTWCARVSKTLGLFYFALLYANSQKYKLGFYCVFRIPHYDGGWRLKTANKTLPSARVLWICGMTCVSLYRQLQRWSLSKSS